MFAVLTNAMLFVTITGHVRTKGIRVERKLAAILAADIVGYSKLMEQDEAGTLSALKAHRIKVFEPVVAKHRGRIFKLIGDGVFIVFSFIIMVFLLQENKVIIVIAKRAIKYLSFIFY